MRAETGGGKSLSTLKMSQKTQQSQDSRLNPGVTRRIPPTGESESSPENTLQLYGSAGGGAGAGGKRSSLATADTASIATNSSANTFIVKSDYGMIKVLLTCFLETLPDDE